jgi:uncharacterized CHY-type Zn-finger protein
MDLERDDLDSNCWDCNEDATTWVHMEDGVRRYFCSECVKVIFRHSTDPEDVTEHPMCTQCRSCGKLTLREFCPVNACPECQSDTDGHAEQFLDAIEEASEEFSEAETTITDEDGVTVVDDE